MAIIAWPSLGIREISWTLDQPSQVNRSAYTGARSVAANPWHGKWSAKVALATKQSEANFLAARAFFASLQGQINTFQLPATEAAQYSGSNQPLIDAVAQGANSCALGTLGSEMVTNGDFTSSTTGWVAENGATLSIVSGRLRITQGSTSAYSDAFAQTVPALTVGATYRLSFEQYAGTANPAFFLSDGGSNIYLLNLTTLGTNVFYFVAKSSSIYISPRTASVTVGQYADFDNISLKQVTPPPLLAGHYLTFPLPSGNKQMVMLTSVAPMMTFVPALREAVAAAATPEAINPYCLVALSDSSFSWDVAVWRQYGMSFNVDEAF